MSKNRKKIIQAIQDLATPAEDAIMSGYVKEVDEGNATMSVILNTSGQLIEGVMLHALSGSLNGMIVIPEVDSDVVICNVDGSGEYMLVQADKIKKVIWDISAEIDIKCDKIVFNGGENYGLVKVEKIVGKLNAIEQDIGNLKQAFVQLLNSAVLLPPTVPVVGGALSGVLSASLTSYSGQQLATTAKSDIENSKISH